MNLGLEGKVAVVSGSSRGIGKATARTLLQEGASVLICGRNQESLLQTEGEFRSSFGAERIASFQGDLTEAQQVHDCVLQTTARFGRLDIAVANIGSGRGVPFEDADRAEWLRMFDLNLFSGMELVRQAGSVMQKQHAGAICLVSSIAGVEALPAPIPYTCAKASLLAAGKTLARSLAPHNVRVNVVCPGNILFPGGVWESRLKADQEGTKAYIESQVPMNRFGSAEEIASCIAFLVSDCASFVTGASLIADGGQTHVF